MALVVALSCVTVRGEIKLTRGSAAPITIFTEFEEEHSPAAFEVMKTELASIMAPAGLDFEWRSLDGSPGNQVTVELVVVSFKGSCRMEEIPLTRSGSAGALGWTHTSDGAVLPFSDVDCDRIRQFIGRRVLHASLHEREVLLGRALGRVLAHELYHVFANTTSHGKNGVAKPFYTAAELIAEEFVFEKKESRALQSVAVPALIRARGNLPATAAMAAR